jgi:hypothetical protein
MRVTSYHVQADGLSIETNEGILQLIPYTTNIVRVRMPGNYLHLLRKA